MTKKRPAPTGPYGLGPDADVRLFLECRRLRDSSSSSSFSVPPAAAAILHALEFARRRRPREEEENLQILMVDTQPPPGEEEEEVLLRLSPALEERCQVVREGEIQGTQVIVFLSVLFAYQVVVICLCSGFRLRPPFPVVPWAPPVRDRSLRRRQVPACEGAAGGCALGLPRYAII